MVVSPCRGVHPENLPYYRAEKCGYWHTYLTVPKQLQVCRLDVDLRRHIVQAQRGCSKAQRSTMSQQPNTGLAAVLQKFLQKIGDVKVLELSTFDGVELMTVYRDESCHDSNKFDKHAIDSLVLSYTTSSVQASKIGNGAAEYSMSWLDRGSIIHVKLEALIATLVMEDNANLGLIDDHIALMRKILSPFSNANFISVTL